jgi:hypothetical protein
VPQETHDGTRRNWQEIDLNISTFFFAFDGFVVNVTPMDALGTQTFFTHAIFIIQHQFTNQVAEQID